MSSNRPRGLPKLLLVTTLLMSLVLVGAAQAPAAEELPGGGTFFDDDGNTHEAYIEALAAAGITQGCDGDLYCPARPITRGEMAAFLVRSFGFPASDVDHFVDDDASIFEDDIDALAEAGVTTGCAVDRFCPNLPISRGQMAAFLVRALGLPAGPDSFVDDDGTTFEADINAVAQAAITIGCNPPANDHFCPSTAVKRDQMASFLGRALELTPIAPPPRPAFTMSFTGDLLLHMPVNYAAAAYGDASGTAYDFRPMFSEVTGILSAADLAICHLEVPLNPTSANLSGYPTFQGPAELADAIVDAGYDGCSVASNHSMDKGEQGVLNTLAVLQDRGLGYAGMASSATDHELIQTYEVDGVRIAHLSYTYGLNGFTVPSSKPWLVDLIDSDAIEADAARARSEGADVVVVSLHWGSEYVPPSSYQRSLGPPLLASENIDLIVGHHAHVVQPIAEIDGEILIYGLGNFLSNQQWSLPTQDGVIVTTEFALRGDEWVARQVTYTPTWVQGGTFKIYPAGETLSAGGVSSSVASSLAASWYRTNNAINDYGADITPTASP